MRGRKPVPAEVRDLTGLKSSHPPANPRPQKIKRPLANKQPPSRLNKRQKEIWREGLLTAPRGILREIDGSCYLVWVMAQYAAERAAAQWEEIGNVAVLTHPTSGKLYPAPFMAIIRQENAIMLRAAAEMGFTPTARMRVKDDGADNQDEEPENPFDQFSGKPGKKPN